MAVEYPIGHRRRRSEGIPVLLEKFERNLRGRIPQIQADAIKAYLKDLTDKSTITRTSDGIDPAQMKDTTLLDK